jgi:hypothetical protein
MESLFVVDVALSESPNKNAARLATSVGETSAITESALLVVLTDATTDDVDGAGVVGLRCVESLALRFGAPATITVCGCGAGAGCE